MLEYICEISLIKSHLTCSLQVLSEGHLMLCLFSFVRANENISGPRDWTAAQFEEIQLQAMACLCALCPLMIDDYMTCQGSTRILLLLEWCCGTEDFGGHGNSFHGTGGRGNKRAQMRHCLRLLRSVVSTGQEVVIQDLADQGAINQIISKWGMTLKRMFKKLPLYHGAHLLYLYSLVLCTVMYQNKIEMIRFGRLNITQ